MPTITTADSTSSSTAVEVTALADTVHAIASSPTQDFIAALHAEGFTGDASSDLASRVTCATDNSIYQVLPRAVVHPRDSDDIDRLMNVACRPVFQGLALYPRGGGTSTNGQSLGDGVVVDTSRYMRRVLDFDPASGRVRVEPGIVRDELNEFLRPHGRFFAPHVSTTNRATLGGMVSNDSSGKGSVVHGKTSEHLLSVEVTLASGTSLELGRVAPRERSALASPLREICQRLDDLLAPRHEDILAKFPDMRRGFTGYNLKEARNADGELNLARLFAGSEGTLGLIRSITLSTTPLAAHTALVVLLYPSHDAGLRAVPDLIAWQPEAIEFVDDTILSAALQSPFAEDVRKVLGVAEDSAALAAHFFEMTDSSADKLETRLQAFLAHLAALPVSAPRAISHRVVRDPQEIARVWEIRRACQGLLAGFDRQRRAIAFIEDCAVPPEALADFVSELETLLKARGLTLGMYGHADVGCVHIRPLMDLSSDHARRQIRAISDEVFALTQRYGGLLWGEHGKGLRGEYSERVIGADLYRAMREIKALFDPADRMNPGKIARPAGRLVPLIALDAMPMRGESDEQVTPGLRNAFGGALRCDGNGACFDRAPTRAMCPSYQATGDRRLSPKGRAGMLREWALARSHDNPVHTKAITGELYEVLDSCLACKACAGAGCSARVDIPDMKSEFLEWYHRHHRRPIADYAIATLEPAAPVFDRLGIGFFSRPLSVGLPGRLLARALGLVDLPALRRRGDAVRALRALGVETLSERRLLRLAPERRKRTIVIVQDCFTSFFDTDAVLAQAALIKQLGFTPVILAYQEAGKPLHVKGFLTRFTRVARRNARTLAALDRAGFALVGVDPPTTLMYRHEYRQCVPDCPEFDVALLDEWLSRVELPKRSTDRQYTLIQHCTERSLAPEATARWSNLFKRAGMDVRVVETGCCGMSGLFGHECRHQRISHTLYERSWRKPVEAAVEGTLVVTGYSCRSQAKRLSNVRAVHPARALMTHLLDSAGS